ncbi:MAG: zf-HC2 domain-containing protein [Planctomycetes bacterium]|nr:zf-HC2 domain-containing protein [Planctomycetota bacterium]
MTSCEYQRQLSAYYDGELPDEQAAELQRHLRQCESCRRELRRLEAISAVLVSAALGRPSREAVERWRGAFRPARARAILRLARAVTAAAAAILLVCSVALWQRWSRPPESFRQAAAWEKLAASPPSGQVAAAILAGDDSAEADESPDVQLAQSILGSLGGAEGSGND